MADLVPYVPTSTIYTAPALSHLGQVATNYGVGAVNVGLAAYDLAKAAGTRDRFAQAMSTANLVNTIAGVFVPAYAALQGIANIQMGLAHGYFAKQKAKKEARRDLRNIGFRFGALTAQGHNAALAARMAAASRGVDPELVAPLGSPFANYSPRTGRSDTELGLLLDFGEGAAADAARQARAEQIQAELLSRPYPAAGVVPPFFTRLNRGF